MERSVKGKKVETISQKDRLNPAMAFVAIVNTGSVLRPEILDWRKEAACNMYTAEVFYPSVGEGVKMAKAICGRCEPRIRDACLEDALAHKEQYGVRGGMTVGERNKLLRKRGQTDAAA